MSYGRGKKADGRKYLCGGQKADKFEKRAKNRYERKRARCNPECQPTYGKYDGYVS